jgi:hypothetical protein
MERRCGMRPMTMVIRRLDDDTAKLSIHGREQMMADGLGKVVSRGEKIGSMREITETRMADGCSLVGSTAKAISIVHPGCGDVVADDGFKYDAFSEHSVLAIGDSSAWI